MFRKLMVPLDHSPLAEQDVGLRDEYPPFDDGVYPAGW
jgi:hypothetical protein